MKVSIYRGEAREYPIHPFHPPKIYPELERISDRTDETNRVYDTVRNALISYGFDKENQGTSWWNPFRELVKPKQTVVIKPNFVQGRHKEGIEGTYAMITHASVIRPIIDYVLLATGRCNIIICDAPQPTSDWEYICEASGIRELVRYYKEKHQINIKLIDTRFEIIPRNEQGIIQPNKSIKKLRDPKGYAIVDLGTKSELIPVIHNSKLTITGYSQGSVAKHHNPQTNRYCISQTVLNADLFINVPKLKTHRKAGLTVAMKNLIGINTDKSWIAHHREGGIDKGGDEYPKLKLYPWLVSHTYGRLIQSRLGVKLLSLIKPVYAKTKGKGKRQIEEGSWWGNDTIWRCIKDINNILFYANKKGEIKTEQQRNYLCVVDGIIAGEKEGPLEPTPKPVGVVMVGENPVAVDYAGAWLMNFDWKKIPSIREGFNNISFILAKSRPEDVDIISNTEPIPFIPADNWEVIKK